MFKMVFYLVIIVVFLGLFGLYSLNSSPTEFNKDVLFEIREGDTLSGIGVRLKKNKLIESINFLKIVGKILGADKKIKVGFYNLEAGTGVYSILNKFTGGKVYTIKVVIPEGADNRIVAKILMSHKLVNSTNFLKLAKGDDFVKEFNVPTGRGSEGFLFPDTYMIPWGASAKQIIKMMVTNFKKRVGQDTISKMKNSSIGFYKSLILASIVEREAVTKKERPIIAGVFLNRFRKRIKFQSCATIQYILGEVREKLLNSHLRIKSPYNTYQNHGFPVGPISNPGLSSIKAATMPDQTGYLYFVSKNDGTHYFSKTGAEHNRAAQKYQWGKK